MAYSMAQIIESVASDLKQTGLPKNREQLLAAVLATKNRFPDSWSFDDAKLTDFSFFDSPKEQLIAKIKLAGTLVVGKEFELDQLTLTLHFGKNNALGIGLTGIFKEVPVKLLIDKTDAWELILDTPKKVSQIPFFGKAIVASIGKLDLPITEEPEVMGLQIGCNENQCNYINCQATAPLPDGSPLLMNMSLLEEFQLWGSIDNAGYDFSALVAILDERIALHFSRVELPDVQLTTIAKNNAFEFMGDIVGGWTFTPDQKGKPFQFTDGAVSLVKIGQVHQLMIMTREWTSEIQYIDWTIVCVIDEKGLLKFDMHRNE